MNVKRTLLGIGVIIITMYFCAVLAAGIYTQPTDRSKGVEMIFVSGLNLVWILYELLPRPPPEKDEWGFET